MPGERIAWLDHPVPQILGVVFLAKDLVLAMIGLAGVFSGLIGESLFSLVAFSVALIAFGAILVPLILGRRKLSKLLLAKRNAGERLLSEARQPQTVATVAQLDDFMDRVTAWYKSVIAILIAADDRGRLDTWRRVDWHRGRPQPRDREEAFAYLARPLWERLEMLENFCRELNDEK